YNQSHHEASTSLNTLGVLSGSSTSSGGIFGMYTETKYTFAMNGIPGNPSQASAAAAFFAR
ncbi:hypothetical protein NL492_26505, partial [Klebsiella pneumoniae]|nr:hypothetical protein [Klebsiella pneumoniae]